MYGYQMIEELDRRSEHAFELKAGTLYPLLHSLEEKGWVTSYQKGEGARPRKYYQLTRPGKRKLQEKTEEWRRCARAVERILEGGVGLA